LARIGEKLATESGKVAGLSSRSTSIRLRCFCMHIRTVSSPVDAADDLVALVADEKVPSEEAAVGPRKLDHLVPAANKVVVPPAVPVPLLLRLAYNFAGVRRRRGSRRVARGEGGRSWVGARLFDPLHLVLGVLSGRGGSRGGRDVDARVDPAERALNPQEDFAVGADDGGSEWAMRLQKLPAHCRRCGVSDLL
jgi:hypothetical protein